MRVVEVGIGDSMVDRWIVGKWRRMSRVAAICPNPNCR